MNGNEKSDLTIVAMKPANERPRGSKEWVERRVGAEGNVGGPHGVRAQERAATSSGIDRVRKAAQERKGEEFTTLLHHIDAALLRQAYRLAETGRCARCGRDDMGRLRRGTGSASARP